MPHDRTATLIVGAGPYGLSLAAYCKAHRLDHVLVGEPMGFWRRHMPAGMQLRSTAEWHLDPQGDHTLLAYFDTRGGPPRGAGDPIALADYLGYADWFARQQGIRARPARLQCLERETRGRCRFLARFEDGRELQAEQVVVATAFGACRHLDEAHAALLKGHPFCHAQDTVDFAPFAGRSLLIVGGRQSAFEWAALAAEAGAAEVHVCHRHPSPAFEAADWRWVDPLLARLEACPGWYRRLPEAEKQDIAGRMWAIGRGRLEPWLAPRIARPEVQLWPCTEVVGAEPGASGRVVVSLSSGQRLPVHQVVLATGYRTEVRRLGFLERGGLLPALDTVGGYPVLSERFESTLAGLYFTNRFASRDFGGFFDFTAGCRAGARLLGAALLQQAPASACRVAARAEGPALPSPSTSKGRT